MFPHDSSRPARHAINAALDGASSSRRILTRFSMNRLNERRAAGRVKPPRGHERASIPTLTGGLLTALGFVALPTDLYLLIFR